MILFKNKQALDRFKASRFEGSAAASAIGGKKFKFEPLAK